MAMSLSDLHRLLQQASSPADVVGPLAGEQQAALRRRYRQLAVCAHPDLHPAERDAAHSVFTALQHWHAQARRQVAQGIYGSAPWIDAQVGGRRYRGYAEPLRGDLCDLYPADADGVALLLKVSRSAATNNLLGAEARALRLVAGKLEGQPLRAHFPTLEDAFLLADSAGARRQVNVLRTEAGTLRLADVLRSLPLGLEPADAAWVFNRILAALAVAHDLGLVHGAVLPEHVLIRPADHNGVLIDWCYSVPVGEPLRALVAHRSADYPPEVQARRPVTPATDIYMAARCMARLLGGTGDAASLPARVPAPLRALLAACLIPAPRRRPTDTWQLFDDLQSILRTWYGPPVFRPFPLPA
jgi:hypothetical protein